MDHQPEQTLTRREQISKAIRMLHSLKDRDPSVQLFLTLLDLTFEEARDQLLKATPTTFAPFQGEALAIREITDAIRRPPPPPIEEY